MIIAEVVFPSKYSISECNIKGTVTFTQLSKTEPVTVNVKLSNVPNGTHGFHIHENQITDKIINIHKKDKINICNELGGHFNPYNVNHGSFRYNTIRHVGDLCNNLNVCNNKIEYNFIDNLISLYINEPNCILNRSIVIHKNSDDEGIPGLLALINGKTLNKIENESLKTGNAGNRIACGNIILKKNYNIDTYFLL